MGAEEVTIPLNVSGCTIATDHLDYLLDPGEWGLTMAEALASREGIALGTEHLAVVALFRQHYERCQFVPEACPLLRGMR
jgi:TusE/DsrC/DsvC family sulfur relay protein